jgi:hypothetical protein
MGGRTGITTMGSTIGSGPLNTVVGGNVGLAHAQTSYRTSGLRDVSRELYVNNVSPSKEVGVRLSPANGLSWFDVPAQYNGAARGAAIYENLGIAESWTFRSPAFPPHSSGLIRLPSTTAIFGGRRCSGTTTSAKITLWATSQGRVCSNSPAARSAPAPRASPALCGGAAGPRRSWLTVRDRLPRGCRHRHPASNGRGKERWLQRGALTTASITVSASTAMLGGWSGLDSTLERAAPRHWAWE